VVETARYLKDVEADVIRPLSQAEAKSAVALLKDAARQEPAIAELLSGDDPLKPFLIAALTLSRR